MEGRPSYLRGPHVAVNLSRLHSPSTATPPPLMLKTTEDTGREQPRRNGDCDSVAVQRRANAELKRMTVRKSHPGSPCSHLLSLLGTEGSRTCPTGRR